MTPGSGARADEGDAWHSRLAACFAGLMTVPYAEGASGSIVDARLGDVSVFAVSGNTQLVRRTTSNARRQPMDLLKVCLQVRGRAVVEQDGAEVALRPGQFALYDTSRPYQVQLTGPWHCAVMTIPRTALAMPRRMLTDAMRRPHPARFGAGLLLAGYLRDCPLGLGDVGSDAHGRLGEAGIALLAGSLVGDSTPAVDVDADLVRRRVIEYIRTRVRSPELSPISVAAAHHLSLRTVQRLFEGEEGNVAALIRENRLEAVRRDLADPLLAGYSIAAIAARSCVTNQPWLSRAFRGRFGLTPSEYRLQVLRTAGRTAATS